VRSNLERDTVVYLTLSREGRPSFFLVGGATINNHRTDGIQPLEFMNGSPSMEEPVMPINELFPSTDRTFKNLTATARLAYKLTRNITGEIFYLHSNTDVDSSSTQFQYFRSQAGFMLTAEWK
jgi:hypothetical protein